MPTLNLNVTNVETVQSQTVTLTDGSGDSITVTVDNGTFTVGDTVDADVTLTVTTPATPVVVETPPVTDTPQ